MEYSDITELYPAQQQGRQPCLRVLHVYVQVVEYSEITESSARLSNEDGSLVYASANICIHFFTFEFLGNALFSILFRLTVRLHWKVVIDLTVLGML